MLNANITSLAEELAVGRPERRAVDGQAGVARLGRRQTRGGRGGGRRADFQTRRASYYYDMQYYTVLYYAMVYYTILYYAMLCYAMLCYAMLCYAVLCYTKGGALGAARRRRRRREVAVGAEEARLSDKYE